MDHDTLFLFLCFSFYVFGFSFLGLLDIWSIFECYNPHGLGWTVIFKFIFHIVCIPTYSTYMRDYRHVCPSISETIVSVAHWSLLWWSQEVLKKENKNRRDKEKYSSLVLLYYYLFPCSLLNILFPYMTWLWAQEMLQPEPEQHQSRTTRGLGIISFYFYMSTYFLIIAKALVYVKPMSSSLPVCWKIVIHPAWINLIQFEWNNLFP